MHAAAPPLCPQLTPGEPLHGSGQQEMGMGKKVEQV